MERKDNPITEWIIGGAIEVHRWLGSGLRERNYQHALRIEFEERGLRYRHQVRVPMTYKKHSIGMYRLDFLVEDQVVVEIKNMERLEPVWDAQILAYMRATSTRVGLLINFNSQLLKHGVRRFVL